MSIWTNKPQLFTGLLALALASCVEPGAQSVVRVGGVALAAPSGYCVAPQSRMQLAASEFVAFARCDAASGAGGAVLTATLGAEGSAAGIDMAGPELPAFVISPEGRRALSQSGRAEAVRVHEVLRVDGALLIRLTDASTRPAEFGRGESWRAVLALRGRLVTLSVSGGVAAPLDTAAGRRLIDRYVTAMRGANAG